VQNFVHSFWISAGKGGEVVFIVECYTPCEHSQLIIQGG
jgi:hypothetical protein